MVTAHVPRRITDAEHQQNYALEQGHHTYLQDNLPPRRGDVIAQFNEFSILDDLRVYIRKTYGQHYAKDGVQAFALIAKRPERGLAFALGNVIKYADRFGAKNGFNRDDLLKVAHYSVLAMYCADKLEAANGQGK